MSRIANSLAACVTQKSALKDKKKQKETETLRKKMRDRTTLKNTWKIDDNERVWRKVSAQQSDRLSMEVPVRASGRPHTIKDRGGHAQVLLIAFLSASRFHLYHSLSNFASLFHYISLSLHETWWILYYMCKNWWIENILYYIPYV